MSYCLAKAESNLIRLLFVRHGSNTAFETGLREERYLSEMVDNLINMQTINILAPYIDYLLAKSELARISTDQI